MQRFERRRNVTAGVFNLLRILWRCRRDWRWCRTQMPPASTTDESKAASSGTGPGDEGQNATAKSRSPKDRVKDLIKSVLPTSVWDPKARWRFIQKSLDRVGFKMKRKKSATPRPKAASKPRAKATAKRMVRPSALTAVCYDLRRMKATLEELIPRFGGEVALLAPPPDTEGAKEPHGADIDTLVLHLMIRYLKPRRLIQLGGSSSHDCISRAIARNEGESRPVKVKSFVIATDANPSNPANESETRPTSLQEIGLEPFGELNSGDLLFVGEEALKSAEDAAFLILEILPTLKPGVFVHVPSVPFPYHVAVDENGKASGDSLEIGHAARLLQAFLAYNGSFFVSMSASLLRHSEEEFLRQHVPGYGSPNPGARPLNSIWLRRVAFNVVELPGGPRA